MGGGRYSPDCKSLMISQKYELAAIKSMLEILDSTFIFKMKYLNFWDHIHIWKIVFGIPKRLFLEDSSLICEFTLMDSL